MASLGTMQWQYSTQVPGAIKFSKESHLYVGGPAEPSRRLKWRCQSVLYGQYIGSYADLP